jgi:hypothetical protein
MPSPSPAFTVHTPPALLALLRQWGSEAIALGKGPEYLDALKRMNKRLQTDPHMWGDIIKKYKHISGMQLRGLVPKWFAIWYGVDVQARVVAVRDLLPAPGSPLSTPAG